MSHKLTNLLNTLYKDDLVEIYNLLWEQGEKFEADSIREHIRNYIIMFYKMSSYKQSCKDKCYYLIKELEHRLENKKEEN